jgi:hypothetical protein
LQFILPYGTTFGSTTFTFSSTADSFGNIDTLSSTTRFYQFPTAWGSVTDATADAMQTASVGTQISAVNSRISGFEGTTAGLNGYVMYRSVTT